MNDCTEEVDMRNIKIKKVYVTMPNGENREIHIGETFSTLRTLAIYLGVGYSVEEVVKYQSTKLYEKFDRYLDIIRDEETIGKKQGNKGFVINGFRYPEFFKCDLIALFEEREVTLAEKVAYGKIILMERISGFRLEGVSFNSIPIKEGCDCKAAFEVTIEKMYLPKLCSYTTEVRNESANILKQYAVSQRKKTYCKKKDKTTKDNKPYKTHSSNISNEQKQLASQCLEKKYFMRATKNTERYEKICKLFIDKLIRTTLPEEKQVKTVVFEDGTLVSTYKEYSPHYNNGIFNGNRNQFSVELGLLPEHFNIRRKLYRDYYGSVYTIGDEDELMFGVRNDNLKEVVVENYKAREKLNELYRESIVSDLKVMPKVLRQEIKKIRETTYYECKEEIRNTLPTHKFKKKYSLKELMRIRLHNNSYYMTLYSLLKYINSLTLTYQGLDTDLIQDSVQALINSCDSLETARYKIANEYLNWYTFLVSTDEIDRPLKDIEILMTTNNSTSTENYLKVRPLWEFRYMMGRLDSTVDNILTIALNTINRQIKKQPTHILDFQTKVSNKKQQDKEAVKIKYVKLSAHSSLVSEIDRLFSETKKEISPSKTRSAILSGTYNKIVNSGLCRKINNSKIITDSFKTENEIDSDSKLVKVFTSYEYNIESLKDSQGDNKNYLPKLLTNKQRENLLREINDSILNYLYLNADRYFIERSAELITDYVDNVYSHKEDYLKKVNAKVVGNIRETEETLVNKQMPTLIDYTDGWFSKPFFSDESIVTLYEKGCYRSTQERTELLRAIQHNTLSDFKGFKTMDKATRKDILSKECINVADTGTKFKYGNGFINWYRMIKLSELLVNTNPSEKQLSSEYATMRCKKILEHLKLIVESIYFNPQVDS